GGLTRLEHPPRATSVHEHPAAVLDQHVGIGALEPWGPGVVPHRLLAGSRLDALRVMAHEARMVAAGGARQRVLGRICRDVVGWGLTAISDRIGGPDLATHHAPPPAGGGDPPAPGA